MINFKIGLPPRAIIRSRYDTSASFLLNRLNWDDLITRRQKLKATLMFKISNDITTVYLQNLFSTRSTRYNFRDSEATLDFPMPRTNYGKRGFCYSGALLWNNLLGGKLTECMVVLGWAPSRQSCKAV